MRRPPIAPRGQLYTAAERRRRDTSVWTIVQGVLAPVQFVACLVSALLIARYFLTGGGYAAAAASVLVKTALLCAIMATGAIWEKAVFGRYLFARPFFWEDVVSLGVVALHLAYVGVWQTGALDERGQLVLALIAYAAYAVNAGQFLLKLRAARIEGAAPA